MLGLGGNAQLGIGLSIILDDRFSAASQRVGQNMRYLQKLNDSLTRSAVQDYADKSMSLAAGSAAVSYGMYRAIKVGSEYEHQLRKVAIVADGALGKNQLNSIADRLSNTFRAMPNEAMGALFENVKAGVTENIELVTKYQMAVAKATDETLEGEEGVAKGLLSIANSMQIPYDKIADVANGVTVAANQSQASVESLNNAMKYTANVASKAGYGMPEILASLGQLSQMGIEGTAAGTAMSNFIRYATRAGGQFATKRQQNSLAMLGMSPGDLRDAQGNIIKIGAAIDLLRPKLAKLTTGEQLDVLEGLFGVRGERAAINLLGKDGRNHTYQDLLGSIEEGIRKDTAIKQAQAMMNDLEGDLLNVKVQWAKFLIGFTKAVEPTLRKLLPILSSSLKVFSSFMGTGIGKTIATLAVVIVPLIGIMAAFRGAVLMATLALGSRSASMGFGTAMQAALGMAGARGMAARGMVNMGVNSAGSLYARAGGGIYNGMAVAAGRIAVPASQMAATFGTSLATSATGAVLGTRAVGLLGGMATTGSSILSFLTGPWGIGIMAAMVAIPAIYSVIKKKDEDRTLKGYMPNFNSYEVIPGYDRARVDFLNKVGQPGIANKELHNNINLYVNGELAGTAKSINSIEEEQAIFNQLNMSY